MAQAIRTMPPYDTGLHELGAGIFAYLQWDGGWGISNAGCVVSDDGVVVIDSLLTPSMARSFIAAVRERTRAPFRELVLTHAHIDHVGGSALFEGAEILAHERCAAELEAAAGSVRERRPWMPDAWWEELRDLDPLQPTRTFEHDLTLHVGGTELRLLHWGPAHTTGDTMVYVPDAKLLFAGDLAFFYATPLCRADMANWVRIIDRIERDLDIEQIVPGHGPPGGLSELDAQREYLALLLGRARDCFDEGLSEEQAAAAIDLGRWARWPEAERKELNIAQLYRLFEEQRLSAPTGTDSAGSARTGTDPAGGDPANTDPAG